MNPELKVGMLAMVVGCRKPKNLNKIGKIVELEYEVPVSSFTEIPSKYIIEGIRLAGPMTSACWVVKGTDSHSGAYKEGFACFEARHLMPLPPLDDDAKLFNTETPKETEKC